MSRFVAFLRAINVGNRRATSADLRAAFEASGFEDVAPFQNAGTVVFSAGTGGADKVGTRLEAGLADALGYEVPVFLRTAAEVRAIARHRPFPAPRVAVSTGNLHVALLLEKPTAATRKEVAALATDEDLLAVRGREVYWLPRGQMRDATLDMKALGRVLGANTMRTKGTIARIVAKHFAD